LLGNYFMRASLSIILLFLLFAASAQQKWMQFNTSNSNLPVNYVFDVELDSIGNAWMGTGLAYTEYGGLAYFNKEDTTVTAYTDFIDSPWFGCYYIHDIEIDRLGRIWMLQEGSSGGVYFESDSFYHAENYVNYGLAHKQYQDPKGGMWIGGGGFQYSDTTYSIWRQFDTLKTKNGNIPTGLGLFINRLNDSIMVLGNGYGAFLYNTYTDSAVRINVLDSVLGDDKGFHNVCLDAAGKDWFSDGNGYLYVYSINDNTWQIFSDDFPPNPFPDIHVYDIVQDQKGVVYIATVSMGLITYSEIEGYKQINIYNDSLPSDVIYDIEVDEFNNKWLGTGWGLVIYNEDGIRFKAEPADSVTDFYFNMFPNPVSSSINIQFESNSTDYYIEIFNMEGQLILKHEPFESRCQIDFSDFQKGVYFIAVKNKTSNNLCHEKIIKI